jgi:hypothetical protein
MPKPFLRHKTLGLTELFAEGATRMFPFCNATFSRRYFYYRRRTHAGGVNFDRQPLPEERAALLAYLRKL